MAGLSRSERRRSRSESRSRGRGSRRSVSRGRTGARRHHASFRLTHQENRLNTCVLCWRRGGRKGSKAITVRPVTARLANTLRAHTHHSSFDLECSSHPAGICLTDLKRLLGIKKVEDGGGVVDMGKDPRKEWVKLKLADIQVPDLEASWDECQCPICHLGHYNPIAKVGSKRIEAVLNPTGGHLNIELEPKVDKKKMKVKRNFHLVHLLLVTCNDKYLEKVHHSPVVTHCTVYNVYKNASCKRELCKT